MTKTLCIHEHLLKQGWNSDTARKVSEAYGDGGAGAIARAGVATMDLDDDEHDYSSEMIKEIIAWEYAGGT